MWTSRIFVANSTPRKLKRRAGQNIRQRTPLRPSRTQADAALVLRASDDYRIAWLLRDLVAGLMLAAIAMPGQLATARLAGMPPETGLYAFAAGSLAFAAFGANRFISVQADSTIAPIFAGGLASFAALGTPHYAELVTLLALMVGVTLVIVCCASFISSATWARPIPTRSRSARAC